MMTPSDFLWEVTVKTSSRHATTYAKANWKIDSPNDITMDQMTAWMRQNNVKYYSEESWLFPRSVTCPFYDIAFNNESDWMAFILTFGENVIRKLDIMADK